MRKNRRAKACDITSKTREIVWERDGRKCVWCGAMVHVMPNAHVISRANGGLGIPENIITLCTNFGNECHYIFDNGTREQRNAMYSHFVSYLKGFYPDWTRESVTYNKYD